jgi:hypothetical protein
MKAALVLMATFLELLPYIGGLAIAEQASVKALKSHKENHDLKEDVFNWCDEHHHQYPKDKDGMATAIAGKVVPLKWRTVRDWITDWAKDRKLRSAGRQDSN